MTLFCSDCPKPISRQSKTGRCRTCAVRHVAGDPAWRERQRAGVAAKFADPAHRAKHRAMLVARNRNPSPALREAMQANGRRLAKTVLCSPEIRAIVDDPAMKAENGRERTATTLAWCPPDRRDEYRELVERHRLPAAEARAMIEADLQREAERRRKRPRTFDEQLAAVAAGAQLIDVHPMRRAGPAYTLGGVAPEAL